MEQLTFDFSEPSRKVSPYANRVYKDRPCDGCGIVYSPRASQQRRCEPCQADRDRTKKRDQMRRKAIEEAVPRFCVDCGEQLRRYRGNHSLRCEPCRKVYKREETRKWNRARTESGAKKVYDAEWRRKNPELARAAGRRYKAAHPEVDQASIHRRRRRSEVRMDEVDRLLSRLYRKAIRNDPCFYCGSAETHEVDHFFPLSKGGTDHWWNLVRSCRPCNRGARGKGIMCGTAFMLRRGIPADEISSAA